MNVRRIRASDLDTLVAWLKDHGANVTTSGIFPERITREFLAHMVGGAIACWVAIDGGKPVGILWGEGNLCLKKDDQIKTAWRFPLLAANWKATPAQQLLIADTLVVEAHKDIIANGQQRDYIFVIGPTISPSARYCRDYLWMSEETRGPRSYFLRPFMEIVDGPHSRGVS